MHFYWILSGASAANVEFHHFSFSSHILFHSGPGFQPYAMILKWRGVWWSAPSIFRGLVAKARPQARQSSFDGISAIFCCSIFHRKNGQNKARIGPFDPGRRGSIDLDARNRFHPTFPGQKCQKIWKIGKKLPKKLENPENFWAILVYWYEKYGPL